VPRQVRRLSENVYEVGEKRVSVRCADGKVMVRVGGGYMPLYVLAPTLVAAGCGVPPGCHVARSLHRETRLNRE